MPLVIYGCETWTMKKAECWKIDAFELWCWRRLLRVPWAAGRSNQSILKEISSGCSLEGLMLKVKLQYFGHLMWWADSGKDPDAGGDWGQEEKGTTEDEMAGWTWVWISSGSWWWTGRPGVLWFMGLQSRTRLSNWTELNWMPLLIPVITILMLLMIAPCIINCLTHFVSASINKLKNAVLVQQGYIKLHLTMKNITHP